MLKNALMLNIVTIRKVVVVTVKKIQEFLHNNKPFQISSHLLVPQGYDRLQPQS